MPSLFQDQKVHRLLEVDPLHPPSDRQQQMDHTAYSHWEREMILVHRQQNCFVRVRVRVRSPHHYHLLDLLMILHDGICLSVVSIQFSDGERLLMRGYIRVGI